MTSSIDKKLIDQILEVPNAPVIVREVNLRLEEEKKKREAFYRDISEYEKAEFINGEIVIHSPVKKGHNAVSGRLYRLLGTYVEKHDLGFVGYEKIMVALTRNDYEPDVCFFKADKAKLFTEDQSLFPAPDLAVEVLSDKTTYRDRGVKFQDYQSHEVEEYWIIDPAKKVIEQYRLGTNGEYELIIKARDGHIQCQPVAGFEILIEAIFDNDVNLKELSRILNH